MKVKDLIEALKEMPQDLEVYSYCDHSQTPEKSSKPSLKYASAIAYSLEDGEWGDADWHSKPFILL